MLNASVLTPTWQLAILTAQKNETTYIKRGNLRNLLMPWRWFKLKKAYDTAGIAEVVALKEDHTFYPRVVFNAVLRLKDGRYSYVSSVCDMVDGLWATRHFVSWNLRTLAMDALTPQVIASLNLADKIGKTVKKTAVKTV